MQIQTVLVAAMVVLVALECCLGVEHDLGPWEPGKEAEYMFWSADHTFHPEDTLKFTYPAGVHNVLELKSEAAYHNCRVIDPIKSYTEANAVVTLPTTGKYYYVCGFPGHCQAGMRLTVTVVPAPAEAPPAHSGHPPPNSASAPPANSAAPVPASTSHPASNSTASPPAPDSGATSRSSFSYMMMGVGALVFNYAAAC